MLATGSLKQQTQCLLWKFMKIPYFASKRLEFASIYLFQHANKLNLPLNSVKLVKFMQIMLVFPQALDPLGVSAANHCTDHVEIAIRWIGSVANFSTQNAPHYEWGNIIFTLNCGTRTPRLGLKSNNAITKPAVPTLLSSLSKQTLFKTEKMRFSGFACSKLWGIVRPICWNNVVLIGLEKEIKESHWFLK